MTARAPAAVPVAPAVIELRRYTLRPGRRDELVDLFDREFVETQEAAGMSVLGQFRDLGDPDRFVWLRGFPDMEARRDSLTAFYGGPVWAEHGPRANATMLDSDDVLLLRPVSGGFGVSSAVRPPAGAAPPDGFVAIVVWSFPVQESEGAAAIRDRLVPLLGETGPAPIAVLVTEHAPNTFPRLPVRSGENVVAVLASYPGEAAARAHLAAVRAHPVVKEEATAGIAGARVEVLRLAPTGRSLVR
ncbi:NIPSNAP protein [Actinocorallia herbida]|uniref:NIPSNAP protein n=1 Tax=Actinocorallia herbida TaxID=58109 RepID=A0A3N1CZN6_9ACTN|nr:NIPSNAP family protein [Actinocorallia herbida]ROO86712.1 NIPSNAP protein [Actinocorallia herbida]